MPRNDDPLMLWVIYDHPLDFPDHFVLRVFTIDNSGVPGTGGTATFDTLAEAQDAIPAGAYNIGREPTDDPVILEVWL